MLGFQILFGVSFNKRKAKKFINTEETFQMTNTLPGFETLFGLNYMAKIKAENSFKSNEDILTENTRIEEAEDALERFEFEKELSTSIEMKRQMKDYENKKSLLVSCSRQELLESDGEEQGSLLQQCEYNTLSELRGVEHEQAEHVVGQECLECGNLIQADDEVKGFLSYKKQYHNPCSALASFHAHHVNILDGGCEVCLGNISR